MSRSLRRGALAAALALSVAPLAACGAGADSQTLQVQPNTVRTTSGAIAVQNAVVVTEPNGNGPASFTAAVFNNNAQPQQLTSISVNGTQLKLTGSDGKGGPLTVPANGSVTLGGARNASAILQDAHSLKPGGYQDVVLDFSSTGQVTVSAAVFPAVSNFNGYGAGVTAVPASPSAPASAAPSAPSASGSPKPGTSPKASGSVAPASPKASPSASKR